MKKFVYRPARQPQKGTHHYLRDAELGVLNAQAVARVALDLRSSGFTPDVMLGHNGWGEIWYLKDVFPRSPLIGYFEFFYQAEGADVGFAPGEELIFDTLPRIRTKNFGNLLGLEAADWGQCPTWWQKSTYPSRYHGKLQTVHEGINTDLVRPDTRARVRLPSLELSPSDEVITYVARNLEPYRGFPSFMRSLPRVLDARPGARVLIVGGDDVSYGTRLQNGQTYQQQLLDELGDSLDLSRVHFLGKVPYSMFLTILQISSVHVYLTYPFVLSWSMLEAMSAGCLVIGSRTAPVQEVIRDGENGWLVDMFNPEEISLKIIEALAEPQDVIQLRKNARQTIVDRYDLNRVCLPAQMEFLQGVV
ncbi:MAG: glycosyltransferase family 4 protein [Oryzomicrobium sp.]|nr:glycosyltransferase family 4 protein [Oryzomicrobium sp.]